VSTQTLFTTSWDDGHPLDVRIADTLEEFGFVGTFYASVGPEGRRLISDNALARIGRNHELGVHGRTHAIFLELPRQALAKEIHWRRRAVTFPEMSDMWWCHLEERSMGQLAALSAGWALPSGRGRSSARPRSAEILGADFSSSIHTSGRRCMGNCLYRRRIPTVTILLELAREDELRERSRRLLLTAATRQRYVHMWGHEADVERLDLWKTLRGLLAMAADVGLAGVSNSEAYDRLSHSNRSMTSISIAGRDP
jgi:hypothetical protein